MSHIFSNKPIIVHLLLEKVLIEYLDNNKETLDGSYMVQIQWQTLDYSGTEANDRILVKVRWLAPDTYQLKLFYRYIILCDATMYLICSPHKVSVGVWGTFLHLRINWTEIIIKPNVITLNANVESSHSNHSVI